MKKTQAKTAGRIARHARIRAKVRGTAERPRLAVFRSNQFLYAQLINDEAATTIAAADTRKEKGATRVEKAVAMGKTIADKAKKVNVTTVTFDRGGFPYKGAIQAFADAAREGGLEF